MDAEVRTATARRWVEPVLLAVVLVASIFPRLQTLPLALAGGELDQFDGDSAYHLVRIQDAMRRFPALLRFDPAMAWPDGAACPWPDGFDLLAAGWGLLAGLGDPARGEMALLLFTPILALLAAWAAMDLARLVTPDGPARPGAAAAAGLLTALAPTSVALSCVGYLDHHMAEIVLALLLAGWALRRFRGPGAAWTRSPRAWEAFGFAATTVSLWVFAGGILYVAIAGALVGAAVLADDDPRLVGSGAPGLAAAAAVSALLALPAVSAHGRALSYQLPSLLQPLLVAAAAAGLALAVAVSRATPRRLLRVALAAGAALAVGGAGLAAAGAIAEVRAGLSGWLLRGDPWIGSIAEFQPLGGQEGSLLLAAWLVFGALGVGAPLVLLAGGAVAVRTARGRGVAFVALTAVFVLLTVNQYRFGRIGLPLLMINLTATLAAFAHRRGRDPRHGAAVALFPLLAALVLAFADPVIRPGFHKSYFDKPPIAAVARDLALQAGRDRSAGVLTPWDYGHFVAFAAGLPTAMNGFGPYVGEQAFREADGIFAKDPAALDAFLERRRLRYVVVGGIAGPLAIAVPGRGPYAGQANGRGAVIDLEYMRAFGNAPLIIGGSGIPNVGVRHLEHLMPIGASRQVPAGLDFQIPAIWEYERVRGARLTGAAPPGARVLATLDFKEQGRPHVWRAFADAGADGRFELVLPFPSRLVRPTIWSAPRWSLRSGDGPAVLVDVPEEAVRTGATVPVDLRAERPGTARQSGGLSQASRGR